MSSRLITESRTVQGVRKDSRPPLLDALFQAEALQASTVYNVEYESSVFTRVLAHSFLCICATKSISVN